jgi:hypothetical protein
MEKNPYILRYSGFLKIRHTTGFASPLKNHCDFLSRCFLAGVFKAFYLATGDKFY